MQTDVETASQGNSHSTDPVDRLKDALAKREIDRAVGAWKDVSPDHPRYQGARLLLAESLLGASPAYARGLLVEAVAYNPNSTKALQLLARAHEIVGDLDGLAVARRRLETLDQPTPGSAGSSPEAKSPPDMVRGGGNAQTKAAVDDPKPASVKETRLARIFLLGAKPSFLSDPSYSIAQRLKATGENSGNQIIAHGLLSTLRYETVSWDPKLTPKEVSENYDVIVIAAANFLFPGFDFAYMADFIEATTLPCVMVGLGAQSNDFSMNIPLQPGTRRLVEIVSERSALIGVRGYYTASFLSSLGIKNVQVVGCPSYYMTCKPELTFKPKVSRLEHVAINGSRDVIRHTFDADKMRSTVRALVSEAVKNNYDFVAQTEIDEMICAEATDPEIAESAYRAVEYFYRGVADDSELRKWVGRNIYTFWNVFDWLNGMRRYDFVIGTRFHGAIAALQSGTPAFVICHDSRTLEMCQFMEIPHINLPEVVQIDISSIYETLELASLDRRHQELFSKYIDFLRENNLSPR